MIYHSNGSYRHQTHKVQSALLYNPACIIPDSEGQMNAFLSLYLPEPQSSCHLPLLQRRLLTVG